MEKQTLINISSGASKISSTSAGFGMGLNFCLSERMPITGNTLKRFCIEANPNKQTKKKK